MDLDSWLWAHAVLCPVYETSVWWNSALCKFPLWKWGMRGFCLCDQVPLAPEMPLHLQVPPQLMGESDAGPSQTAFLYIHLHTLPSLVLFQVIKLCS